MTASEVINHLKAHIAPPAFCFLEQVADGTGARQHRWADAVAMSVWPSRGYDVHGFEVKVSRYDWLNELKQPEKSAAVQQYCDRWWIATPDESIIQAGELPPTWGWMICKGKGMKIIQAAPKLTPKPPSVEFIASILRNFAKADETDVQRRIHEECQKVRDSEGDYSKKQYASLKKTLDDFELASGIRIAHWDNGKELGDAVSTLRSLKWQVERIGDAIKACETIGTMLKSVQTLADLKETVKELTE